MNVGIHFGALAPSMKDQLAEQGLVADEKDLERWQGDALAINRLRIRGLIADGAAQTANKRLLRAILKKVDRNATPSNPAPPTREGER